MVPPTMKYGLSKSAMDLDIVPEYSYSIAPVFAWRRMKRTNVPDPFSANVTEKCAGSSRVLRKLSGRRQRRKGRKGQQEQ